MRTLFLFVALAATLAAQPSLPQAAVPLPWAMPQFFGTNGHPLAAGKVYSYVAGTTTPLATYTDSTATVQNTNPVILDVYGRAAIWIKGVAYKITVKDSNDVVQWTADNVTEPALLYVTQLQAIGDSALLSYTAQGTGAVARTVSAKLRETITPQDFGAYQDGTHDDAAAIQAALAAGAANGGRPVIFPGTGTYKIGTKITIPQNVTLVFEGATLKAATGLNDAILYASGLTSLRIVGQVILDGNKANQSGGSPGYGLWLNNCSGTVADAIQIKDTMKYGLFVDGGSANRFGKISVSGAAATGAMFSSTSRAQVESLEIDGSAGDNLQLWAATDSQLKNVISRNAATGYSGILVTNTSQHNVFGNLTVTGNGASGLHVDAGSNSYNSFSGIVGSDNVGYAVKCDADSNVFGQIVAISNTTAGTPAGAGVYVLGSRNNFSSVYAALNAGDGVRVQGYPGGAGGGVGNVFSAVVAIDNSQAASGTYSGVSFVGATYTVVGTLHATGSAQKYGLDSAPTSAFNAVMNASLNGNGTGDYETQLTDVLLYRQTVGGGSAMVIDAAKTLVKSSQSTGVMQFVLQNGGTQGYYAPFTMYDADGTTVLFSIDQTGVPTSVPLKSSSGTWFVCIDSSGVLSSSATPCAS